MNMQVIFGFVLFALATASLTRLIVKDRIFLPIQRRVVRKYGVDHWLTYLINCPYCVSMWFSIPATIAWILLTDITWWWLLPGVLAMRYVVAPILIRLEGDD